MPILPTTPHALVTARLGAGRMSVLRTQPLCRAAGGLRKVISQALAECAGHEDPVRSATIRVLQACGSVAQPSDLEP